MIKLVFIGSYFHEMSTGRLGPIVHKETYEQPNWKELYKLLEKGEEISIKPATKVDLKNARQALAKLLTPISYPGYEYNG